MLNTDKLFDLSNKVIILTGAGGLLGSKYAEGLSQAKANVVLVDKNISKIKKQEKFLNTKYGVDSLALKIELTDKKSVQNLVKQVLKKYSRIDGLINNAMYPEGPKERSYHFENFPLKSWNDVIDVNLTGVFLCCQEVGKIMKKQNSGVIVNISSIYGMVGADQRIYGKSKYNSTVIYGVTKGAILNFTKYLASYWNNTGIRVNTLSLGGVENNHPSDFIKNYSYRTMMGRMAKKNEYVGALIFLLSDASSYMTGSNLVVDGGWTAW
jgi:NAD(P)-dependent dehydrogenase (short-subunit alcohol dehydrogenase family)